MVQIISRSNFTAHTEAIFNQLKIINIYIYISIPIRKIIFFFKIGRLPDALKLLFSFSSSNHRYYTRQCNAFYIPLAEQILDSLPYVSQDLKFSIL